MHGCYKTGFCTKCGPCRKKNYNYNAVILTQSHSITECPVGSSALTTLKTQIIQTMMVEGRQDSLPLWTAIRYESAKYGYQEVVS